MLLISGSTEPDETESDLAIAPEKYKSDSTTGHYSSHVNTYYYIYLTFYLIINLSFYLFHIFLLKPWIITTIFILNIFKILMY